MNNRYINISSGGSKQDVNGACLVRRDHAPTSTKKLPTNVSFLPFLKSSENNYPQMYYLGKLKPWLNLQETIFLQNFQCNFIRKSRVSNSADYPIKIR